MLGHMIRSHVFVYTSSMRPIFLLGRYWVIWRRQTTKWSLHRKLLFDYSLFSRPLSSIYDIFYTKKNKVSTQGPLPLSWMVVFYVPSTARSFRDGTPIYCLLRRTWSSDFTSFPSRGSLRFNSRWERCENRASRPSQGTVNSC